jgi:gamma-glutamylcyclotransferase (GGCT)/AIG2-like uncharacterized protein YtfP
VECFSVFAYGTLKKEQLRGSMWPKSPLRIELAIARGELFDLGVYPGLSRGNDEVLGELWTFDPQDIPMTLGVLDEIEGYDALRDRGLYLRRRIQVIVGWEIDAPKTKECYVYLVPDVGEWPQARRIVPWLETPWPRKLAVWPDGHSRVPRDISEEED